MTTAIFNPALASVATQVPLLTSPWRANEDPAAEVAEAFSYSGLPLGPSEPELIPIVSDLRRVSPHWNACYYDAMITRHVEDSMDLGRVKERLAAELDFFTGLYSPRQAERFRIYPMDDLRFSCDDQSFSTIVFAKGKLLFGCADFDSSPDAVILDYIQGLTCLSSNQQREIIGDVWFEAFMARALQSFDRLHRLGVKLMLRIEDRRLRLPRMVRDRYFTRYPENFDKFYPLNYDRARVKRAMGAA